MNFKKGIVAGLGIAMSIVALTGCAARMFEEKINVVFKNEGAIVDSGTVTQFDNIKSPTISDAYIPTDFRFLGWTAIPEEDMDYSSATNFKSQYIGAGRMVHYMTAVTLEARTKRSKTRLPSELPPQQVQSSAQCWRAS